MLPRFDFCRCGDALALEIALQPLQLGAHFGSRLIADVAILLERPVDDFLELVRNIGIDSDGRDRRTIQD